MFCWCHTHTYIQCVLLAGAELQLGMETTHGSLIRDFSYTLFPQSSLVSFLFYKKQIGLWYRVCVLRSSTGTLPLTLYLADLRLRKCSYTLKQTNSIDRRSNSSHNLGVSNDTNNKSIIKFKLWTRFLDLL